MEEKMLEAMNRALEVYRETKSDFDAGRYEGLKEAIGILEKSK